jgi:hypothetical protein
MENDYRKIENKSISVQRTLMFEGLRRSEFKRLCTWNNKIPRACCLAKAGFIQIFPDAIQCVFCLEVFTDWKTKVDKLLKEHRPLCHLALT